jgi:predicted DCC family thiol-disulfide oxidoreductase YuxK
MKDKETDEIYLLFDSECTMCSRFKQGLELIDRSKKITFYSIHEDSTYKKFPNIKKEDAKDIVHLIKNGKIFIGGEVITELVKLYPTVSKLSWLLDSEAGKKAMDLFYNKVNELRKSKLNPCPKCKDH